MSDICCEDLVDRFATSNYEDLEKNIHLLLEAFENDVNSPYFLQVLKTVFGPVMVGLPIESLEPQLFLPILPCVHKIFDSNLSNILYILESNEDSDEEAVMHISSLIQVCLDILECFNDIMMHIMKLGSVKSEHFHTLEKTLPSVLRAAFNHCRESENNYGPFFSLSANVLTSLFRKSYEILINLYKVLNDNISFECIFEDEIEFIVKVLEDLCSIGDIIIGLDMKAVIDHWKGLGKLLSKYSSHLKNRFDVAVPIKSLVYFMKDCISSISSCQDDIEKTRSRNLKICSFILKILVKISELYLGYLGDCHEQLLDLLFLLNRCSKYHLDKQDEELERHVVVGAGALLNVLYEDREFIQIFDKMVDNPGTLSEDEIVGFFFTNIRLLKLLIRCQNEEIQNLWLRLPLIQNLINLFTKIASVIDFSMKVEGSDIYSTLVGEVAAYIISSHPADHFIKTEHFFMLKLFDSHIETSLLISDIICLLCRFSTEDVCLRELHYICGAVFGVSKKHYNRPELCLLRVTARRLFSLLTPKVKKAVESFYSKQEYPDLWFFFGLDSSEFHETYLDFQNIQDPSKYFHYVYSISLSATRIKVQDTNFQQIFVNKYLMFWFALESSLHSADFHFEWWYHTLHVIVKMTPLLSCLDNSILEQVIKRISHIEIALNFSPIFYFYVSHFLKGIANFTLTNDLNQKSNFTNIKKLFVNCLLIQDPLLKQLATENYVYYAHYTPHEEIISTIMEEKDIHSFLSLYLRKAEVSEFKQMFSTDYEFVHKCNQRIILEKTQLNEETTPDSQMKEVLLHISAEIEKVKNQFPNLTVEDKKLLFSIYEQLSSLLD